MKYIRGLMGTRKFKHIRRKIRYTFILLLVRFMIWFSQLVPRKIWLYMCGALGTAAYYLSSVNRKNTFRHLSLVFGREKTPAQIRKMSREVFNMMGKNAGDIIRAFPVTRYEKLQHFMVVNGTEYARQVYEQKKGIIFLTAHIGAFELVATVTAFHGFNPLIVGTPLKDRRLQDILWKQRSKLGAQAISRGKESYRLMKNLMSGGTMGILIDQDTRVKSVFVNFFGMPCATPVGATIMALKTGAPVIPTFIHMREDGKQEMTYYPELPLVRTGNEEQDLLINTQRFNDVIEAEIRKHPTQWVWMHERWKTKPGDEVK